MSKPVDCVVVGAGLVGLATARALAREGLSVTLVDRGPPGAEASGAAAGMLAPQIEAHAGDPMLPLTLAARDRYVSFIDELRSAGHQVELSLDGIALVAFDEARAQELTQEVASQHRLGLDARWLEGEQLRAHQPGIAPNAIGALLAPRDGRVDSVALCAALAADAAARGATLERAEVRGLTHTAHRITGVDTSKGSVAAGVVVVAAGAWSARLEGLPLPLPIEPVRGQMAAVPWPGGLKRTVLFGRGAYVVPRGGEALLGSTMEKAGFDKSTTEAGLARIKRETDALLPALRDSRFSRTWSGLRPVTPDLRPIIGREEHVEGLVYATGHGRNGILLGPLTGDIVRDLVTRGATSFDLAPFAARRFQP